MSDGDFNGLVRSIRAVGLLEPIALWRGQVIYGRHRLRACLEAGVEPSYTHLDRDDDPLRYAIARNVTRRRLEASQRAIIAHRLSDRSGPGSGAGHITQSEAAGLLGVSRRSVTNAGRVLSENGAAVPAVRRAVEEGLVTVSDAARVLDQPSGVQEEALERVSKGEDRTLAGAARRVNSLLGETKDAAVREANLALTLDETATLRSGAVSRLVQRVEAGTVDAVITHPPHDAGFLLALSDLASFAAHALGPGGVVVMSGVEHLPEVFRHLTHPELRWVCEFDYRYDARPSRMRSPTGSASAAGRCWCTGRAVFGSTAAMTL